MVTGSNVIARLSFLAASYNALPFWFRLLRVRGITQTGHIYHPFGWVRSPFWVIDIPQMRYYRKDQMGARTKREWGLARRRSGG